MNYNDDDLDYESYDDLTEYESEPKDHVLNFYIMGAFYIVGGIFLFMIEFHQKRTFNAVGVMAILYGFFVGYAGYVFAKSNSLKFLDDDREPWDRPPKRSVFETYRYTKSDYYMHGCWILSGVCF